MRKSHKEAAAYSAPEQHYTMHFDADLGRYSLAAGLERFASMFLYLTSVDEGGETIFPEADDSTYRRGVSCGLVDQGTRTVSNDCTREEEGHMVANCAERAPGLVVPPKRGTLMLWYNYDEEGKANTRAIHAGSCLHTVICRIRLRPQLLTR